MGRKTSSKKTKSTKAKKKTLEEAKMLDIKWNKRDEHTMRQFHAGNISGLTMKLQRRFQVWLCKHILDKSNEETHGKTMNATVIANVLRKDPVLLQLLGPSYVIGIHPSNLKKEKRKKKE